jgi:hypothetical protein
MFEKNASCSCGQLGASVTGEPVRISVCHCLACQKRTGSTYGMQARFPVGQVKISGQSSEFARVSDAGHTARFRFCPQCGATVYYTFDDMPDYIAIPVGAFADPAFPQPTVSVYEARKHAWVGLPPEIEHLD